MNSDTSSSATSQYHAQLYSGQKQLQKRHQQQQQSSNQHLHRSHSSNTPITTPASLSNTTGNSNATPNTNTPLSLNTLNSNKPTYLNYKVLSFEPPNLYHTSLKLTSEIDIHAWWSSLVKIFSGSSFHATRIALSIPQDPNDPYNGPWGLKAVYNKTGSISQDTDLQSQEDRDSDTIQNDGDDYFLHSHTVHETTAPRHIPWCFDRLQPFESEPEPLISNPSINRILKRNAPVVLSREYRRRSSASSTKKPCNDDYSFELFKRAIMEKNDKARKSNWTMPIITTPCFSKEEASEILVDGTLLSDTTNEDLNENTPLVETATSTSITHNVPTTTFIPNFDEYEQQQPSPWSQSPAPSPAIMDSEINPFFQSPPDIDDDAFNPVSPEAYDNTSVPYPPPISNVHSVVHVPLFHPSDVIDAHNQYQYQQNQYHHPHHHHSHHHSYFPTYTSSNLVSGINNANPNANGSQRNHHSINNPTPIAILSFLAPVVPYPPVLLSSINSLSPFIAASFTNANQNSKFKKQGQLLHNNSSSGKRSTSSSHGSDKHTDYSTGDVKSHVISATSAAVQSHNKKRPKYYTMGSSSKSLKTREQKRKGNKGYKSNSEDEAEDFFGSATTTPIAAFPQQQQTLSERPDHLHLMSNFTRSSLETVQTDLQSPLFPTQQHPPFSAGTAVAQQSQSVEEKVPQVWNAPTEQADFSSTREEGDNNSDTQSLEEEEFVPSSSATTSDQSTFSAPAESLHRINNLLSGLDDAKTNDISSHRKGSSLHRMPSSSSTSNSSNSNNSTGQLGRRQSTGSMSEAPTTHKALSPSSIALMEGWGAVSPTTGLPIAASVPPHDMCSDLNCCCDNNDHSSSLDDDDEVATSIPKSTTSGSFLDTDMDEQFAADVDDEEDDKENHSDIPLTAAVRKREDEFQFLEQQHQHIVEETGRSLTDPNRVMHSYNQNYGSSSHHSKRQHRPKRRSRKKKKYVNKHYQRQQQYDDDGFHYHHNHHGRHRRTGSDPFLVVPRSSLLRLIIDGIPIHVFTCSTRTGQVTWVNNRTLQYTGRSLNDHLGPKWLSHMHPDDQPECRKAWEQAYEQGNGFAGEYRLRRFDGVYRCFLWRIVPLRDLRGRIIHWFGTCTDVHDQHIAKESNLRQVEIESNERKYRLLAEAIPQIVFTFSPSVGLTYANGKWSEYSGKSYDDTMGLGFMSCVHPDDRAKLNLPDLPGIHNKAGISWQDEIRLLSADEEYKWFLVKCVSVNELKTGDVRWFGTCTDINDHKLLEQKLKEAHDAAQKSTESKTRFLSNMSHEIRTPLIGITGMLNFLLDTELTAEQIDYVHTIQQSAESLLVVINDILDLSKVEAGMMKLEWEPFSLITMIEDANELLSTLAIQKNLELSFWIDEDVPDVVVGDRVRLRQVLLNLIGNAIKFTSEGEVFTNCMVQNFDQDESELTLLFEVIDTGSGFDAMEESVMFKPFSQVDSSSTRKHGGSGLGLVISRQLVELHGGTMKCRSQKGKGSTFYFTVKFSIPSSHTQPLPQTPQYETTSDPFFRSNGYDNINNMAQSDAEKSEHRNLSPIPFVTKNNKETDTTLSPTSRMHVNTTVPTMASVSTTNDAPLPADVLQNVLMSKAATMQLKPPPIRNTAVTTVAAHAAVAAAANTILTTFNTALSMTATEQAATGSQKELNRKPSMRLNDKATSPATTDQALDVAAPNANASISMNKSGFNLSFNKRAAKKTSKHNSSELRIPTFNNGSTDKSSSLSANSHTNLQPPRTPTTTSPLRALIVSEWKHSRECIEKSVDSILDSIVNPSRSKATESHSKQCTLDVGSSSGSINSSGAAYYCVETITNQIEAIERLTDPNTPTYDYILINLTCEKHILSLTKAICASMNHRKASVLVVTTPIQRSLITEGAKGQEDQFFPETCGFVFKPLKRAKLRWFFGIRDRNLAATATAAAAAAAASSSLSATTDTTDNVTSSMSSNVSIATPDTPYKRAATQKEIFKRMAADVGGKGYRVLLVEDNLVNQKVLTRYLARVGLNVDVAAHGGECLELFYRHPKDHYCLILCDLFMPVKDGYETTREIREWEKENLGPSEEPKPIIALSANVMSDVADKCFDCGFSTYISKPVNFAVLSDVIRNYLLKKE